MTFSIAGRCAKTGALGAIATSSSISVASRCIWARAGVGAVVTQNLTNPDLGILGVSLMGRNLTCQTVCEMLVRSDEARDYRQLILINNLGGVAEFSGKKASTKCASASGLNCVASGNLLASESVPERMVRTFEQGASLCLEQRLLNSIHAGLMAGGEKGALRSVGMLVVDNESWPVVDLRVDDNESPIQQIQQLWSKYAPVKELYRLRAKNPKAIEQSAKPV